MLILEFLRTCTVVLWFYNGPLVSKEHSSAPLISKEHYSAPLADNSAPLLKGALLKWANSALQKSNAEYFPFLQDLINVLDSFPPY